jgi:DNA-binding LacI/PurR family transcriptional regulator
MTGKLRITVTVSDMSKSKPKLVNKKSKAPLSLRDLASAAGVSRMTASRAFKEGSEIRPELREKILKIAKEIGYQPDPMVTRIMSSFVGRHAIDYRETIAVIWWPERWPAHEILDSYSGQIYQGVENSAAHNSCKIEHIVLSKEMSASVINRMLKARNIKAVILTSPPQSTFSLPKLDWDQFSVAIIGTTIREPNFHRARPSYYTGLVHVLQRVKAAGFSRPCLLVDPDLEERMERAYSAGFLAWEGNDVDRIWKAPYSQTAGFRKWLKTQAPDVIIGDNKAWLDRLPQTYAENRFISLGINSVNETTSGLYYDTYHSAECAVDLVIRSRFRNQTGVPKHPVLMTNQGVWMNGETFKPNARLPSRAHPSDIEHSAFS